MYAANASFQLLDCVSITAALTLSCLLLKVRYKIVHIVGVSICLMGVGCLVWANIGDGRTLTGGKFTHHARNYDLSKSLIILSALSFFFASIFLEFCQLICILKICQTE
jgi:hypothetical protein